MKKKNNFKGKRAWEFLCLVAVFSLFSTAVIAQTPSGSITVKGRVTDALGIPIVGATITRGESAGTITDSNGHFSIEAQPDATLTVSILGYETTNVKVTRDSGELNITLQTSSQHLDEIVVIGYGTMRKRDLTGSVASVKGDVLNSYSTLHAAQALQGRVSGVQVLQNNGHPGAGLQIRIRGTNSIKGGNEPLFIIDGFPGDFNLLNTSDIESMEVLKDASATAIYGSRGANGVVIITTRQGRQGKLTVDYSGSLGFSSLAKKLDLMNASEYMQYMNEQYRSKTGGDIYYTDEQISAAGEGTDWQDVMFRTAQTHNHSININGGNETVQASLGASYLNQQGIIPSSGYNRMSLRSNVNLNLSKKVSLASNLILSRTEIDRQEDQGHQRQSSLIGTILVGPPTLKPYNDDGTYADLNTEFLTPNQNPVAWVNERLTTWYSWKAMANLALTYKPIEGLAIRLSGNANNSNNRHDAYVSTRYPGSVGEANIAFGETTALSTSNTITYDKVFADHHRFSIMGGMTYDQSVAKSAGMSGKGYLTDDAETYNIGSAQTPGVPSSGYEKWSILSYLGRLNYSYDGKYLATVNFRADGSSRFSPGSKWGYFPSMAFAWRISQENFMKGVTFINDLKLRAGYGMTGNPAISPYSTLSILASGKTAFNKDQYTYFRPSDTYQSSLKWEVTHQYDIGLDLVAFNNRLRITADYYNKKTVDLLNTVEMPRSSGYTTSTQNIGQIQNSGFEFQVDADIFKGPFKWNVIANAAFNRNKVLKLSEGKDIMGSTYTIVFITDQINLVREGEPIGVFYGFREDGYDDQGRVVFKDDGDGVINANDKHILGNPNPKAILSLNSTMEWRNLQFSFFLQSSLGNDIYSLSMAALTMDYNGMNSLKEVLHNHWSPETPNAKYPALWNAVTSNLRMSDRYVCDGSYLKLRNIEFAYALPLQKFGIQKGQVYVSAQNIFTLTSYPFWDVEVNAKGGSSSVNQGIDEFNYPSAKTYTVGVRFVF